MLFLAAIAFGALGLVQHVSFADAAVRAEIRFRIVPDRYYLKDQVLANVLANVLST
jgi:hypothetical protein